MAISWNCNIASINSYGYFTMKALGLDIESDSVDAYDGTIWSIAVNDGKKDHLFHNCNGLRRKDLPNWLIRDLEDPNVLVVIHNGPFDGTFIELKMGIVITNIADTMARELVIQGIRISQKNSNKKLVRRHNCALENVLPRYGFPRPDKTLRKEFINRPKGVPFRKALIVYMVDDAKYLIPIYKAQEYILKRDGQLELGLLEDKMSETIVRMRAYGVGFDAEYWRKLAERTQREYNRRLNKLPNVVANWNSHKQIKDYFMSRGIYIDSLKNLEDIQRQHGNKILENLISVRELSKTVSTYGMNWFEKGYIKSDGRIHGNFDQIVDTGRMSSSNPNLQNLPKGGLHRGAFVSKKGYSFVISDFTGQEIGIMAAGSGEKIWINAMLRGEDVHSLTASLLYESEWSEVGKRGCSFPAKCKCPGHLDLREKAKTLNFMLAYGGGAEKFSKSTGVDLFDSKVIIKRYKKIIPRLTYWLQKNGDSALYKGETYSASPYRRRRVLMGSEDWHIVNQGKNSPIQGAGADMLKLAMISVPIEKYPIALVIHDEIICEVPDRLISKAVKDIKSIMERTADYITGIKGLIKVTPRVSTNLLKP